MKHLPASGGNSGLFQLPKSWWTIKQYNCFLNNNCTHANTQVLNHIWNGHFVWPCQDQSGSGTSSRCFFCVCVCVQNILKMFQNLSEVNGLRSGHSQTKMAVSLNYLEMLEWDGSGIKWWPLFNKLIRRSICPSSTGWALPLTMSPAAPGRQSDLPHDLPPIGGSCELYKHLLPQYQLSPPGGRGGF